MADANFENKKIHATAVSQVASDSQPQQHRTDSSHSKRRGRQEPATLPKVAGSRRFFLGLVKPTRSRHPPTITTVDAQVSLSVALEEDQSRGGR